MGLHGPVLAVTWLFIAPELGRVSRENVNPEVWEEEVRVLFRPIGFEGLMCTVGSQRAMFPRGICLKYKNVKGLVVQVYLFSCCSPTLGKISVSIAKDR
jgi:hypothetical protein